MSENEKIEIIRKHIGEQSRLIRDIDSDVNNNSENNDDNSINPIKPVETQKGINNRVIRIKNN